MIDNLFSIIAPHSCCGCGELGSGLCQHCLNDIKEEPYSQCLGCMRPVAQANVCATCKGRFHVEDGWCASERRDSLKRLIDHYKFDGASAHRNGLVELLDAALPLLPADITVTAIPTASPHVRVRGYDHMAKLAKGFARQRQLHYQPLLMRKTAATQHFMKSRQERLTAAKKAFGVKPVTMPRKVLLLDDIVTTGATLEAAAELLKKAGVSELYLGVVARQPGHED
jgi:ComF family protein